MSVDEMSGKKSSHVRYVLRHFGPGPSLEIELTEMEYRTISKAKEGLSAALAFERQYAIIVECYVNFANEILLQANELMIRGDRDYLGIMEKMIQLDLRLINLLTATRMYREILLKKIKHFDSESTDFSEQFRDLIENAKRDNPEVLFMEGLRDYSQHHDFPTLSSSLNSRLTDFTEAGEVEYRLSYYAKRSILRKTNYKEQNGWDLSRIPDRIDLKDAARKYAASFGRIHSQVRTLLATRIEDFRKTIENAIDRFRNASGSHCFHASIAKKKSDEIIEEIQILLSWDNVRASLAKRYGSLDHVATSYVTGESGKRMQVATDASQSKPAQCQGGDPEETPDIKD